MALGHFDRASLIELKSCIENGKDMTPVGTCLLEQGVITQAQLDEALRLQNRNSRRLETILIDMGVIDQATLQSVSTRISGPDA